MSKSFDVSCKNCGHPHSQHFKKNYLCNPHPWPSSDLIWGNVDFHGCDGTFLGTPNPDPLPCDCKQFIPESDKEVA